MFCSLKNGIESIAKSHRLKKYFIYDKIIKIWNTEIDNQIKENTKIVNLNNYIVIIETSTPTWKTELAFQKTELLNIINQHLKKNQKIKDIKFI